MVAEKNVEIFTIPSSDSWNEIICNRMGVIRLGDRQVYRASLTIFGNFWDRELAAFSEEPAWSLTNDHRLELPQVLIHDATLDNIRIRFEKWLQDYEEFSTREAFIDDQGIVFHVGEREDVISRKDRPVLTLNYTSTRLSLISAKIRILKLMAI